MNELNLYFLDELRKNPEHKRELRAVYDEAKSVNVATRAENYPKVACALVEKSKVYDMLVEKLADADDIIDEKDVEIEKLTEKCESMEKELYRIDPNWVMPGSNIVCGKNDLNRLEKANRMIQRLVDRANKK